jgi:hypothetical protein
LVLSVAFFPNKSLTRGRCRKTEPLLSYITWEQVRERNKALDTFVGALAMRKSLPHFILARQSRRGESQGFR